MSRGGGTVDGGGLGSGRVSRRNDTSVGRNGRGLSSTRNSLRLGNGQVDGRGGSLDNGGGDNGGR